MQNLFFHQKKVYKMQILEVMYSSAKDYRQEGYITCICNSSEHKLK